MVMFDNGCVTVTPNCCDFDMRMCWSYIRPNSGISAHIMLGIWLLTLSVKLYSSRIIMFVVHLWALKVVWQSDDEEDDIALLQELAPTAPIKVG